MNKRILLLLLLVVNQAHAYQIVDGQNILFTDLLVWKLREGSAENWSQSISPPGTTRTAFLQDAPFSWDAGFRIGVGRKSDDHFWTGILSYTHFQTLGQRAVSTQNGGIHSAFTGNFFANNPDGTGFGPNYVSAQMDWTFSYHVFDLTLSHDITIDSLLTLRPVLGIKGAIINQTLDSHWNTPTVPTTFTQASETLKNNFWGIGPSVGIESIWPFYQSALSSVRLTGKLSGALLAGHWSFEDNYVNGTPNFVSVNMDNLFSAASMASGFIGLEWEYALSDINMMTQIGYEAQVWFNQLQYYSFNMGKLNHLMSLQGGVLAFYVNL